MSRQYVLVRNGFTEGVEHSFDLTCWLLNFSSQQIIDILGLSRRKVKAHLKCLLTSLHIQAGVLSRKAIHIKQTCIEFINPFPARHNFCCLLSHLHMFLDSLYGPRSDCSLRSGLIRVWEQSVLGSICLLP